MSFGQTADKLIYGVAIILAAGLVVTYLHGCAAAYDLRHNHQAAQKRLVRWRVYVVLTLFMACVVASAWIAQSYLLLGGVSVVLSDILGISLYLGLSRGALYDTGAYPVKRIVRPKF